MVTEQTWGRELSPSWDSRGTRTRSRQGVKMVTKETGPWLRFSMPITHQAPFGTMGTIHASDSLKHERGVSRLEGEAWALEGPVVSGRPSHSRGWDGATSHWSDLQSIPNLSKHSRPRSTGRGSMGLWVCGLLFCFFEDFFFKLCSEPLVHCTIEPCKGTWD